MEDYEELMLQISDVMREANRVRPELSHEQAIKNIRGIVERHGKWIAKYDEKAEPLKRWKYYCTACGDWNTYGKPSFCMKCGARMDIYEE